MIKLTTVILIVEAILRVYNSVKQCSAAVKDVTHEALI